LSQFAFKNALLSLAIKEWDIIHLESMQLAYGKSLLEIPIFYHATHIKMLLRLRVEVGKLHHDLSG
jgi:hypothetical protein